MADPDNLMFKHLRAIRSDISGIEEDMRGMRAEMTAIRPHLAGVMTLQEYEPGDLAAPKVRIDRIERRLELTE